MADAAKATVPNSFSVKIAEHFGLVATGIFLVIVLLGYVFLFAPAIRKMQEANRTQQLQREMTTKQGYLKNLQTLKANYDAIPSDDVQKIRDMIPFADDLPGLTAEFDALAKENDADLTSISFSGGIGDPKATSGEAVAAPPPPPEAGSPAGLVPLTISITLEHADYKRVKLFLQSIERHIRIFDITSMSLDPAGAQYVMAIRTYVHPPAGK